MDKIITRDNLHSRKYLLAPTMSLLIVACGGGGGDVPAGSSGTDTVPPVVTASANINVAASNVSGTPATNITITAFLDGTTAIDNIDGAVSVTNNAPATFPVASPTTVTFSASDTAGNTGTATATVTVGAYVGGGTSWSGTKQHGAALAFTYGSSVATDTNGNVYVAGTTNGALNNNTITGILDTYVTKYDNSGVRQYTRQIGVEIGTTAAILGYSVTTDANDNVYVAGYTNGDLNSNMLSTSGAFELFVTKYDSIGAKQYTLQLGVAQLHTYGTSVATDANGNIYVAGWTTGGLDGNTLTGSQDLFVTKYDSTGVKQYTRQLGVVGAKTFGNAVATDATGNVYVAGIAEGILDGNTLAGYPGLFVTKYDSDGVMQYTRQDVAGAYGNSVAADANGNVYVAGYTNVGTGNKDFFVIKYDSVGVMQYTRQLGVMGADTFGRSVTTDVNGNVYVAGDTKGGLDGNMLIGSQDFFVTKYDSIGVKQFTRQLGVTGFAVFGYSVTTDANGNVYVAGTTSGAFDGNTQTGFLDFFVTRFNSNGVKQ